MARTNRYLRYVRAAGSMIGDIINLMIAELAEYEIPEETLRELSEETESPLRARLARNCALTLQGKELVAKDEPHAGRGTLVNMGVPWVPEGYSRENNLCEGSISVENRDGELYVDGHKAYWYLTPGQTKGVVRGVTLEKELEDKPLVGTALARYLLDNPTMIPESWKGKLIFFWGTILRNRVGDRYVLCLSWCDEQWQWGVYWLGLDFAECYPALLLAK